MKYEVDRSILNAGLHELMKDKLNGLENLAISLFGHRKKDIEKGNEDLDSIKASSEGVLSQYFCDELEIAREYINVEEYEKAYDETKKNLFDKYDALIK